MTTPREIASPLARRRPISPRVLQVATWGAVALLAALALAKLPTSFERLTTWSKWGATDLHLRFDETRAWFMGFWLRGAVYPPASQTLLWPAVGWLPFPRVRFLWAALSFGSLAWLSWICARECGLRSTAGKAASALLPLAASSTASAVGIGQIVPLFLPLVSTAVLWMARGSSRWADSVGAAVLFTVASVKPTLFAPFAWLVLLLPRSFRPALLSGTFYVALTMVALAAMRPVGKNWTLAQRIASELSRKTQWATSAAPPASKATKPPRVGAGAKAQVGAGPKAAAAPKTAARPGAGASPQVAARPKVGGRPAPSSDYRTRFGGGYGNLQNMSQDAGMVGLQNFVLPIASVLACGAWLFRRRRTDPWILLGVCAIAARMGWYHRFYDDMLLVLPVIALIRILGSRGTPGGAVDRTARIAAILLAATLAHLLAPGVVHGRIGPWMDTAAAWVWFADLLFLANVASSLGPACPEGADSSIAGRLAATGIA